MTWRHGNKQVANSLRFLWVDVCISSNLDHGNYNPPGSPPSGHGNINLRVLCLIQQTLHNIWPRSPAQAPQRCLVRQSTGASHWPTGENVFTMLL